MFKKMTKATAVMIEIVIVLGILILVNILTEDVHARWDLTEDNQYTLSDESKAAVGDLKDDLRLTLYTSLELPSSSKRTIKQTKDLLREYRAYSNSNFILHEEHPDAADEKAAEELYLSKGIHPEQIRDYEATSRQTSLVYVALLVSYGDKHEAIMSLKDSAGLEYKITRAILKVSAKSVPVIGVFGGAGVNPILPEGRFSGLGEALRMRYEVRNVDLSMGPVNEKVETLLLLGPKTLTSREKVALDQYIMHGGKAVFFIDTVDIPFLEQSFEVFQGMKRKLPTPWADILGNYGFQVSTGLVIDTKRMAAIVNGPFTTPYPLWPKVNAGSFGDLAFTSNLEVVFLPWVSPVEYTGDPEVEGRDVDYIFTSSEDSYLMKEPFEIHPRILDHPNYVLPGAASERHMGVMVKGVFNSFYAGKKIPTVPNEDGDPESIWKGEIINASVPTEIVVIGSSNIVSDMVVDPDGSSENATFILNMMDSMNLGGGLSGLRSRRVTDRPLKEFEKESEKGFLKFAGIWLIPIILSIFGVGRYFLRLQTRKFVEMKTVEMS